MAPLTVLWGIISFCPVLGAALAIGLLSGHAPIALVFVTENETRLPDQVYTDWLRKEGMRGSWRAFLPTSLLLTACLPGWVLLTGYGVPLLISAAVGFLWGVTRHVMRRYKTVPYRPSKLKGWQNNSLPSCPGGRESVGHPRYLEFGLASCAAGFALNAIEQGFAVRSFLGPLGVGIIYAAGASCILVILWLFARAIGKRSLRWPFHLSVIASLLLISGGPLLWFAPLLGIPFGWRWHPTWPARIDKPRKAVLRGIGAIAVAHTFFQVYFYDITSSSGPFSSAGVLAVAPYALSGVLLGVAMRTVHVARDNLSVAEA